MTANHVGPLFNNVRERRAARLAREAKEAPEAVEVEATEEANAGAQSEPQASDSADAVADEGAETDTQGFEKPMTFGSVDG